MYYIYIIFISVCVCIYIFHDVFVNIHTCILTHMILYVGNFDFKAAFSRFDGDLARKKVTFNSETLTGPPGLENLDKSKPMCPPFENTRKTHEQIQLWSWYWVVDIRNESCNGWQPLNGVELGVWVRYVPLEEDLAWCRSTASGSAPESSEEEVLSSEAFGDGYTWPELRQHGEKHLTLCSIHNELKLETPSELERQIDVGKWLRSAA